MKKISFLVAMLLFMCLGFNNVSARDNNNANDSITFIASQWELTQPDSASSVTIARMHAQLFNSPQSLQYIKFPLDSFALKLVPHQEISGLKKVSDVAVADDADIAINAGYWNMSNDVPATYLRVDGVDRSRTEDIEAYRVNGYVIFDEGKFDIGVCDTTQYAAMAGEYENILTCGPLLIDNSRELDYTGKGSFFSNRHPRSVIGLTPDNEIIFLVVDGRVKGEAAGVSIPELTQICRWLGMTDALNLDGGGSSTLWDKNHGIINHPSDNKRYDFDGEREVSSSILAKKRH